MNTRLQRGQTPESLSMKSSPVHQALSETPLWVSWGPRREKQTVDVRTPYLNDSVDGHPLNPIQPPPPAFYLPLPILQPSLSSPGHHPHHMFPPGRHNNLVLSRLSADSFCFLFIYFFFPSAVNPADFLSVSVIYAALWAWWIEGRLIIIKKKKKAHVSDETSLNWLWILWITHQTDPEHFEPHESALD